MSKLTSILEHNYYKDSKYVFVHNYQNLCSPRRGEHLIQERQDDKKEVINSCNQQQMISCHCCRHLVNHKKVWRLMKELAISSVNRKKRKHPSYTPSVVYPNRLQRQFHAPGPQQKLVLRISQTVRAFITCLPFRNCLTMRLWPGRSPSETT